MAMYRRFRTREGTKSSLLPAAELLLPGVQPILRAAQPLLAAAQPLFPAVNEAPQPAERPPAS